MSDTTMRVRVCTPAKHGGGVKYPASDNCMGVPGMHAWKLEARVNGVDPVNLSDPDAQTVVTLQVQWRCVYCNYLAGTDAGDLNPQKPNLTAVKEINKLREIIGNVETAISFTPYVSEFDTDTDSRR